MDKLLDDMKIKKKKKKKESDFFENSLPKTYIPKGLTEKDKKLQLQSIKDKKDRPKVESFKSKRSGWVKKFENKYKTKINDKSFINKNILKNKGQELIIDKGMGAYYSSGSRPNQTVYSWGYGRLASVILGGKARQIDKKIWDKYKIV
tara:strand:- start:492 stop:935 length:444 start_codon:yes stop_codon:yes gene_type:complete